MAIVQASEFGVARLGITPNFKVKSHGTTKNFDGGVVYKLSATQADLLGFRKSLIDLMVDNYGCVLVHHKHLTVE